MAQEENEMARSFVVQPNSLFLYELPLPVPSQLAYQTVSFFVAATLAVAV